MGRFTGDDHTPKPFVHYDPYEPVYFDVNGVVRSLQRLDLEDYERYKDDLRKQEKRSRRSPDRDVAVDSFDTSHPGYPLGKGYPLGLSLRLDGETHRQAWQRILRQDPCAYCDKTDSGTLDHIEPKSKRARGIGGKHSWVNYTAACPSCNFHKTDTPMLHFLLARAKPTPTIRIRRELHPDVRELELGPVRAPLRKLAS